MTGRLQLWMNPHRKRNMLGFVLLVLLATAAADCDGPCAFHRIMQYSLMAHDSCFARCPFTHRTLCFVPFVLVELVTVVPVATALGQCGQAMNQCMRNHNWSDTCSCRGGYTSCVKALGCSDDFVRSLIYACEMSGCPSSQVRRFLLRFYSSVPDYVC